MAGLALAPSASAQWSNPAAQPFIQRVALTDFQLLETNNDLVLSPDHELVLAFTNVRGPNAIDRAVALKRLPDGSWRLTQWRTRPSESFAHEEISLAPEIARNVIAIARHLLEVNVRRPTDALHAPSSDDDAWIFLRTPRSALTGVALSSVLRLNRGAETAIYRDLCAGLVGVFTAPPEERAPVFKQLDRLTAEYVAKRGLNPR